MKILVGKLKTAKRAPTAYRMARKLLPDFFSPSELKNCTCVPPKPGAKVVREQADHAKMKFLLGNSTVMTKQYRKQVISILLSLSR